MVRPVTRNISPQVLRPLVQAIREKKRVDICYTSLKDGEQSERIISPHTLFCTPLRWKVRAYCEQAGGYRDFVLSRILGIPDINNNAIHGKRDDVLWNTKVNIELIPDLRLNEKQRAVIEKDYAMSDGVLRIMFTNTKWSKTKLTLCWVEHCSYSQHLIFGKSCQRVVY